MFNQCYTDASFDLIPPISSIQAFIEEDLLSVNDGRRKAHG